jgi:hypothetical protein
MKEDLILMFNEIKAKFTDDSDMIWTSYETPKEVRDELDYCMEQLPNGNKNCLEKLNINFLPSCTFHDHSIQNSWSKEYVELSTKFDNIYNKLKSIN